MIDTLNYSYYDSRIAKLNDTETTDNELRDLLIELVTMQGGFIDALERQIKQLRSELNYEDIY